MGLDEPVGGEPAGADVFDRFDEQPIARLGQTSSQRWRPPPKTVHAEAGPVRIDVPRGRVVHPEDRRKRERRLSGVDDHQSSTSRS